jgi:AGZA family xanthine/uracil permease-like MFS transporter
VVAGRFKEINPALLILAAIFVIKFAYGVNA